MPTRLGGMVHELHFCTAWARFNRGVYHIISQFNERFEVIRTAWQRMGTGRSHYLVPSLTLSTDCSECSALLYLTLAGRL